MLRVRACELFHHVFVSLYVTFSLAGLWSCLKGKSFILFCSFGGVFYWCSHLFSYTVPGAQTPELVADSQCDLAESRRRSQFSQKFIPLALSSPRFVVANPIKEPRERRPPSLPGFACLFVCCRHNDTYIYRRYSLPPSSKRFGFSSALWVCVFLLFQLSSRALPRQFHGSPLAVSGLRYFPVGLNCFRTSRIIYVTSAADSHKFGNYYICDEWTVCLCSSFYGQNSFKYIRIG